MLRSSLCLCWLCCFPCCLPSFVVAPVFVLSASLTPRVVLCAPWSSLHPGVLVPPSGYLVASVTAVLPCFHARSVVKLCYPSVIRFMATKATRRPDGSVGMALVLPALTDCRWWFESLLVHSGVSSATRRKATGADQKKWQQRLLALCGVFTLYTMSLVTSGSLVWPY